MADDEARDERLGESLGVEPLDEVTKRRLVATAMRETKPRQTARWVAVAAAVVVVLVAGFALVTAPGGHDEHEASIPARTPASVPEQASPSPESLGAADSGSTRSAAPTAAPPVDLGDFGDLADRRNVARLRAVPQSASPGETSSVSRAAELIAELETRACRSRLPRGTVTGLGSGTLDGREAIVVVTALANGERSTDAVLAHPCEVRPLA